MLPSKATLHNPRFFCSQIDNQFSGDLARSTYASLKHLPGSKNPHLSATFSTVELAWGQLDETKKIGVTAL
jgi:hypothetical protein